MTTKPLYYDVSTHQGSVDMGIVKDTSDGMLIMRGGISWGYEDPRFRENYANAGSYRLNRMVYFVPYPDQPVDRQVNNWFSIAPNLHYPLIYDLELQRGMSPGTIANHTWAAFQAIKARTGHYPVLYSRKGLIDIWLASWTTDQLNSIYYHLAQYLNDRTVEDTREIILPNRVERNRVILHQTCDKKPGADGMVESSAVDYNRWLLPESFNDFAWNAWGVEPEFAEEPPLIIPPAPSDLELRMTAVESELVTVNNQLNKLEFLRLNPLEDRVRHIARKLSEAGSVV